MPASAGYRKFVRAQLERLKPVRAREMSGGFGIHYTGLFLGLIHDDRLYFKVGQSNRRDYEKRGMRPFAPHGKARPGLGYYQLPADVLEEREELAAWMETALSEARAKAISKRRGSPGGGSGRKGLRAAKRRQC